MMVEEHDRKAPAMRMKLAVAAAAVGICGAAFAPAGLAGADGTAQEE